MSESAGGAATASGMNFQALASAWYCVGILAEAEMTPPLGLSADTRLEWLMCETGEPVDDLLIGTSSRGFIFAQAKNSLSLGEPQTSAFASVVDQFVRQYLTNRDESKRVRSWHRPLDPSLDRLVLLVGPESSSTIRDDLPALLEKVRALAGRPLGDAPTNADEERVLRVLRNHVTASWQAATAHAPSTVDELAILTLVRVQVLDLRNDGFGEREARGLLRTSVLEDPSSDAATWNVLANHCSGLAAIRASADRYLLLQVLLEKGVAVKVPRSYRSDIEKLQAYTARSMEFLSDLSKIDAGAVQVRIRRECTTALLDAALRNSVLVIGDPGAGKSGALHELATASEKHADCIVLLVDRLSSRTVKELGAELGVEHDLLDTLKQWTSARPGILVIDALDAAREESAAQTLRDLIRLVVPLGRRWHVVASIRKFDLRYGEGLKKLFVGKPPSTEFVEREFSSIRHIKVPTLSDDELAQIGSQAPLLAELVSGAPAELRALLRVPFNIRLIADLLADGVPSSDLTPVRTQLELLDRYWSHRVIGTDTAGDQRETLLRAACEQMVAMRTLQIDRAALSSFSSTALNTLLSSHVLAEWSDETSDAKPNRYIISFSHHVLYDYSVARLLMRGPSARLLRRLADHDFVLVVRPSVGLHFQHLWSTNRGEFWDLTFEMLVSGTSPKTVDLVGPTVAAQGMLVAKEFDPVFNVFESPTTDRKAAETFLAHVVGAILTDDIPLVGSKAKPWCEVLERLSSYATRRSAFPLRALALTAMEKLKEASAEQLNSLGAASRTMLAYTMRELPDVPNMISAWIQVVCRTLATQPTASEDLLRRLLEPARMNERGFLEIPWLSREISHAFGAAPIFARDTYAAAFTHREESTLETAMGTDRILALTSNRKQDFESALWSLSEAYPGFVELAPVEATDAMVTIIGDYVLQRHRFVREDVATFEFRGRRVELLTDYSEIWDSGSTYSHDEAVKILDAFEDRVRQLSTANDANVLERILEALSVANPVAVVWRRLLDVAAGEGGLALARLLVPLLQSPTVLWGQDTIAPAGRVLQTRAQDFDSNAREKIERAVLSLADGIDDRKRGEYLRAKLLGCFPRAALVLEESRTVIDALRAADKVPSNAPSGGSRVFGRAYTEETHLQEMGVKLDDRLNKRIIDLTGPIRQFGVNPNVAPTLAEVETFIPQVEALVDLLNSNEAAAIELTFRNYTWGHIAAACATAAHCSELDANSTSAQVLRRHLLAASRNQEPSFDEELERQFDSSPGWGSPAARIDAARGLMAFARLKGGATDEIKQAAQRLAFDRVAAVRYQVAVRLLLYYEADRQFVWALSAEMATREQNRGVLLGLVGRTLGRLASTSEDEGFKLLREIYERLPWKAERDAIHREIIAIVAQLFAYRGNANAARMVQELIENSAAAPRPAEDMLFPLRKALIYGADKDRPTRQRAIKLYLDLLRAVDPALRKLESAAATNGQWTAVTHNQARALASVIQDICDQVYFASGAFETSNSDDEDDEDDTPDEAESRRFYEEADELVTELTQVGLAGAAHKVVETLAFFVPLDAERVFIRIADCVRNSRSGGYQFETLAASLIVKIVERYLADYRQIFRDNEQCRRDLLELLDTFVEAGWPSARKLTYKLDEIFR